MSSNLDCGEFRGHWSFFFFTRTLHQAKTEVKDKSVYVINSMWFFFSVNACHPTLENDKATFRLNLQDIYQCMVTKVVNKETVCLSYFTKFKFYLDICEILLATFYRFNLATSHNFFYRNAQFIITALLPSLKLDPKKSF